MAKPDLVTRMRIEKGKAARRRGKAAQEYYRDKEPDMFGNVQAPEKVLKWWQDQPEQPYRQKPNNNFYQGPSITMTPEGAKFSHGSTTYGEITPKDNND